MREWDDGSTDEEIYDLVETLNEDYGVKTTASSAGSVRKSKPYLIMEIPKNNAQYLRAAIREYDYKKDKEVIMLSGLEILIGEEDKAVITFKGIGIQKRKRKLKKQREEFKETILKVITAYVNEERRRGKINLNAVTRA